MGLHQKITDRITSEPCNCGADDDHGAVEEPAFFAYDLTSKDPWPDIEWTDGTEASE